MLNWTQGGPPDKLFYKGGLKTKSFDIAEAQNQFFIDKVSQIKSDLPCPVTDPLAKLRSLMCNRSCTFRLTHVHPDQVESIINNLKNSNSFGLDEINAFVIKLVSKEILPALTHVINLSIACKKFPTAWKRVKIIPLHKKEDRLNPKNYRPVAIVPFL